MANTVWFNDGTYEVLFDGSRDAFARILRDRLGPDVERVFMDMTESMQARIDGYESCDTEEALNEALEDARKLNLELLDLKEKYAGLEGRAHEIKKDRDRVLAEALKTGRKMLDLIRKSGTRIPDSIRAAAEDLVLLQAGDGLEDV